MALEPIRARKLSDAVYGRLERLIVTNELAVGQRLPSERELATQLGVSRGSIREAIHELELKRFVQRKSGRGTVVLPLQSPSSRALLADLPDDERDVVEIMDFRLTLEPPIAALAARRATPGNLRTLMHLLDQMVEATDRTRVARLDEAFHAAVAGSTHNRLLLRLHEESADWLRQIRREALQTAARRAASLAGHRRIFDAIEAGDSAAASAATVEHVQQVRQLVESRGLYKSPTTRARKPADAG